MKAWRDGTHRSVSRRHLAVHLDEFAFRHNRRPSLAAAFSALLGLGAAREPTACDTITGAKDLPEIVLAPSRAVAGDRGRRRRFTPAEPTMEPADHKM